MFQHKDFINWRRNLKTFKLFSLGYSPDYDRSILEKVTKAANNGKVAQYLAGEMIEYIISAESSDKLTKAYLKVDEAMKIEKRLLEK